MKQSLFCTAMFSVVAALATQSALADSATDFGKREFDAKCASCHGVSGKGDGPMKSALSLAPADLTAIAKKNNGVLPVVRLQAVIDGRAEINSHGPRVMPVWGQDYLEKAGTDWPMFMDARFDPNVIVRSRIMALIDYIARLQEK